jgi:hypothetical protein
MSNEGGFGRPFLVLCWSLRIAEEESQSRKHPIEDEEEDKHSR